MWTREFWMAASERAIRTVAQVLLATLPLEGLDVVSINWQDALSIALGAALLSLLTSITTQQVTKTGPSLVNAEVLTDTNPAPRPLDGGYTDSTRVIAIVALCIAVAVVLLLIF